MTPIRDWLYLGKYAETLNLPLLKRRNIGAMLLFAELVEHPGITSFYLPVEDGLTLSRVYLRAGLGFVQAQKQAGRVVLVACGAGISRSAAFVTAALKEAEGLPLAEAYRQVRLLHPPARIHSKIWFSLCAFYGEEVPYPLE